MDFIIDEAEVSDEFYSENSECPEDESLLDDFIKPDNKCEDEIDSATFYKTLENFKTSRKKQLKKLIEMKGFILEKAVSLKCSLPKISKTLILHMR